MRASARPIQAEEVNREIVGVFGFGWSVAVASFAWTGQMLGLWVVCIHKFTPTWGIAFFFWLDLGAVTFRWKWLMSSARSSGLIELEWTFRNFDTLDVVNLPRRWSERLQIYFWLSMKLLTTNFFDDFFHSILNRDKKNFVDQKQNPFHSQNWFPLHVTKGQCLPTRIRLLCGKNNVIHVATTHGGSLPAFPSGPLD